MDRDTGHQSIAAHKCQGLEPRTREKKSNNRNIPWKWDEFFFCVVSYNCVLIFCSYILLKWLVIFGLYWSSQVKTMMTMKFGRKTPQLTEAKPNNDSNALIVGFSDDTILIHISSIYSKGGSSRRQMHRQVNNIQSTIFSSGNGAWRNALLWESFIRKIFIGELKIEWLWRISNVFCLAVSPHHTYSDWPTSKCVHPMRANNNKESFFFSFQHFVVSF